MKYKHSANLVIPFLILSALPASADPVLWNYATRTVDLLFASSIGVLYLGIVKGDSSSVVNSLHLNVILLLVVLLCDQSAKFAIRKCIFGMGLE
jgi:uncharacterized membrane protein YdjX (TVP38/TMEM64 family)